MKWRPLRWLARLLSFALVPYILLQNRPPTSTLAWLWTVIGLPWIGPLIFLVFGGDRVSRRHSRKARELEDAKDEQAPESLPAHVAELVSGLDEHNRELSALLERVSESPTTSAGAVRLLIDGGRFFPALLDAIENARHHAHIEFFIFRCDDWGGRIRDALIAASQRGVEVRLLCDSGGCAGVPGAFFDPLIEAGGKFSWFRSVVPLRNRWTFHLKNHRKLQVIDGAVAFVGGMNVGDEYAGADPHYGAWHDAQVELRGAAVVPLQRIFAADWFFATDEELSSDDYYLDSSGKEPRHLVHVVSDGPDIPEDRIQLAIVALLNEARHRAWLTTGYFVPNEPLLSALQLCAARGVDVRLIISGKTDHPYLVQIGRSYYEALLRYGVRIFEYGKGINHAKVATVDSQWMMVGSANFDIRSMRLNFELNVVVHDPERTAELERVLRNDTEKDSVEIHLEEFRKRPFKQRALESLFRPLAPLL